MGPSDDALHAENIPLLVTAIDMEAVPPPPFWSHFNRSRALLVQAHYRDVGERLLADHARD